MIEARYFIQSLPVLSIKKINNTLCFVAMCVIRCVLYYHQGGEERRCPSPGPVQLDVFCL